MKAVVERVKSAALSANGKPFSKIGEGLLVFVGVEQGDDIRHAEILAKKIANLRIFCDSEGKMNLSCQELHYQVLAVSNFTLCADTKKGNRPSFINAMESENANCLYELFCTKLKQYVDVQKGVFKADMSIQNVCDGPITIFLDTNIWIKDGNKKI